MLKLFRKKVSIESVSIPDIGWELKQQDDSVKKWINADETMMLSLHYFPVKPDLPSMNMNELRSFYRSSLLPNNGGLIKVECTKEQQLEIIHSIFKLQQKPSGTTYLGSLTIPFKTCSFVVKIQAPEIGASGIRESVMSIKLLNQKKVIMGDGPDQNWSIDPYSPDEKNGYLMNQSEREEYDNDFPTHPLTQVRNLLKEILKEISIDEELKKLKPFK